MDEPGFWRTLATWTEQGEACALATVVRAEGSVPRHAGAKMLVRQDGTTVGSVGGGALEQTVVAQAREALLAGEPRLLSYKLKPDLGMVCGGSAEVFVEPLLPAARLLVFGGGHIALALVPLAARLGFSVTVVDDRPGFATAERFPASCARVASFEPAAWKDLALDERAYCVVVTATHAADFAVVRSLLEARPGPAYVGMIGSHGKRKALERALEEAGIDAERVAHVRTPMGVEIGAETPEEIAVSIAAELVQVRRASR